jgi:hypothetical protein
VVPSSSLVEGRVCVCVCVCVCLNFSFVTIEKSLPICLLVPNFFMAGTQQC